MQRLLTILIILTATTQSPGQSLKVEKYFEWYQEKYIINDPAFAHSDTEFLFCKQFNIPDGGDAIGRDEYVNKLLQRAKKEVRFADPVVSIINLRTRKVTAIDYGWEPNFSSDDRLILYAFQTRPITGYRVLAQTENGNKIKIYNRITKSFEIIATPIESFFLEPKFFDSATVFFKVGKPVNGSYGGGAGLCKIDLLTKKIDTILGPVQQFGQFSLVGSVHIYNKSICYTLCEPEDSSTYRYLLRTPQNIIVNFGEGNAKALDSKVAFDEQDNILFLDDDHDLNTDTNFLVKYSQGVKVSKRGLYFKYHECHPSPNGKYMVYDDYNGHFYLINLQTFDRVKLSLAPDREIHSVTWSVDGKKFAVVQDHETLSDTDKIRLFKIK